MSLEHPHLGLIILIVKEIKDVCTIKKNHSETMQLLKSSTLDKVDSRIKVSDAVKVASVLDLSLKNTVKSFFINEDELKTILRETAFTVAQRKIANQQVINHSIADVAESGTGTQEQVRGRNKPNEQTQNQSPNALETGISSKKRQLLDKFAANINRDVNIQLILIVMLIYS